MKRSLQDIYERCKKAKIELRIEDNTSFGFRVFTWTYGIFEQIEWAVL